MKFTNNDKKELVKEITNLSNDEHIEIFKIIKNYTDKYTKNDNGVFINVSILNDHILTKIKDFVNFCIDNRERLEQKEEIMRNEKNKLLNKNIFEEKIQEDTPTIVDNNEQEENISDEEEMEGIKISLKRLKPKYVGAKAKIIKNYKQNSNNLQSIIYKNKKNKKSEEQTEIPEENEYEIGEETYDDEIEEISNDIEEDTKNE